MSQDLRVPAADGLPLRVRYWRADVGTPVVLGLHGLGSTKDHHTDFAERCVAAGLGAALMDLRGHGETGGSMGPLMVDDVVCVLERLGAMGHPRLGLRGSSMGGFLALHAAVRAPGVAAVVAICPAQAGPLSTRAGAWAAPLAVPPVVSRADGIARGYWHATGDEVVPWGATMDLMQRTHQPKRLCVVLGGHHRSLQHDPGVMADTVAFLVAHL